jgi:hypothetical protein
MISMSRYLKIKLMIKCDLLKIIVNTGENILI